MKCDYSIREIVTKPIACKISNDESLVRSELLSKMIDSNELISVEDYDLTIINNLIDKNILKLNDNKQIIALYPVSGLKTNKKVIFSDGKYSYAMCALDALGFHYAFNEDIRIESECAYSGDKIILEVKTGRVNILSDNKDSIYVLCADLDNMTNWSCCCCNIMHFFSSKEYLEKWVKDNNITSKYFALDIESANKLSWLLFSN